MMTSPNVFRLDQLALSTEEDSSEYCRNRLETHITMANYKVLKEGVLYSDEKKRRMILKQNEWKTTEYYAELRQHLETIKMMICLFKMGPNKKTSGLKDTIELTRLDKISLEPTVTVEKHRFDKYLCIEACTGCTTFLRFDTKAKRDEWYDTIASVLTPNCNLHMNRRATAPQKDLIKTKMVPPRNIHSEPIGSAAGFSKVLDEMKSNLKINKTIPEDSETTDDGMLHSCCPRHHNFECHNGDNYANIHSVPKTKSEFTHEMNVQKKMVIAHRDVYRDFNNLLGIQSVDESPELQGKQQKSCDPSTSKPVEPHYCVTEINKLVDQTCTESNNAEPRPFGKKVAKPKQFHQPSNELRQHLEKRRPSEVAKCFESEHILSSHNDGDLYQNCRTSGKQPTLEASHITSSQVLSGVSRNVSTLQPPVDSDGNDPVQNVACAEVNCQFKDIKAKPRQSENKTHIHVAGNNNTVINLEPGSTLNFYPIGIPGDVFDVDESPPKKKPKLTKQVCSQVIGECSSQPGGHDSSQDGDIREQNRLLRQQNFALKQLFRKYGAEYEGAEQGSIVFKVRFKSKADLEKFWQAYKSGQLAEDLSQVLLNSSMEQEAGCKLKLHLHLDDSVYQNGLKALANTDVHVDTTVSAGHTQDASLDVNDIIPVTSHNSVPAKRKCVRHCHTSEYHLDTTAASSKTDTSQSQDSPYEVMSISELVPNSANQQHDNMETLQGAAAAVNEPNTRKVRRKKIGEAYPLFSESCFERPSTLELRNSPLLPNVLMKTYTVEKIARNATRNEHLLFQVNGNCLEYDDNNSARKRRVGLDELINVEMNENLKVHTHKYENIICLRTKCRVIYLQTESRNEMKECYSVLMTELRRSGWKGSTLDINTVLAPLTDATMRRATTPETTLRPKYQCRTQTPLSTYGGYVESFNTEFAKLDCKAVCPKAQNFSTNTKDGTEESIDVTTFTNEAKSLQIHNSSQLRKRTPPPATLPKPKRKYNQTSKT